jgi:hypothetical protein
MSRHDPGDALWHLDQWQCLMNDCSICQLIRVCFGNNNPNHLMRLDQWVQYVDEILQQM